MKKKISLIFDYSSRGGANIAASRIEKILRKKFLVDNLYLNERDNFGKFKILAAKNNF